MTETIFDFDLTEEEKRRFLAFIDPPTKEQYLAEAARDELSRLIDIYKLLAARGDPRKEKYKKKILKIDPSQRYNLFYRDVFIDSE